MTGERKGSNLSLGRGDRINFQLLNNAPDR